MQLSPTPLPPPTDRGASVYCPNNPLPEYLIQIIVLILNLNTDDEYAMNKASVKRIWGRFLRPIKFAFIMETLDRRRSMQHSGSITLN